MKMTFGNKLGVNVETSENLFDLMPGAIVVESTKELRFGTLLGKVEGTTIKINGVELGIDEAIATWEERYAKIYPFISS